MSLLLLFKPSASRTIIAATMTLTLAPAEQATVADSTPTLALAADDARAATLTPVAVPTLTVTPD